MSALRILSTALLITLSAQSTQPARASAPEPVVTPVMLKDLTDLPGREMLMITVVYPPGTVLYKDSGFQGYEPAVAQTCQAKKKATRRGTHCG